MIASDYSSDDSSSSSDPELVLVNVSRMSETGNDTSFGIDSPLKRAIKENEDSIIHSILSPPPQSPFLTSNSTVGNNSENSGSASDKITPTIVTEGLSPLLDYLFEDGQLTRMEYDTVDKGYGINSALDQVQVLLRILLESKDDTALKSLLWCLKRLDPASDTIHRLYDKFLPRTGEKTKKFDLCGETQVHEKASSRTIPPVTKKFDRQQEGNEARAWLSESEFSLGDNRSSKVLLHDFYYGTGSKFSLEDGQHLDASVGKNKNSITQFNARKLSEQKQLNKSKAAFDDTDYKDFYLTNGCLETIRNLILDNCEESCTALAWEKVLRNMNGLLNTDVQPIKDMLHQIQTLGHQRAVEAETRVAKVMMKRIHRERRNLHQHENVRETKSGCNRNEKTLRRYDEDNDVNQDCLGESSEKKHECNVNWNQVIYHSFQVWKQRNGINSTFYSLIGVFQHSNLFQTSDFLMDSKKEIQLRENDREIEEKNSVDINNGTRAASSTMLEKSDFLRKFYSPSRRNDFNSVGLTATKDRVSVSPVLSLDLL